MSSVIKIQRVLEIKFYYSILSHNDHEEIYLYDIKDYDLKFKQEVFCLLLISGTSGASR